jgi:hypothetical protein
MRLTWRDLIVTPFMVAIIAVYAAHVSGADGWLLSSTRGSAVMILILGYGGCRLGIPGDVYKRGGTRGVRIYAACMSVLGVAAVVGGVTALVAGNGIALAVLFGATMALWVPATARHAITKRHPPESDAEVREILTWVRAHH